MNNTRSDILTTNSITTIEITRDRTVGRTTSNNIGINSSSKVMMKRDIMCIRNIKRNRNRNSVINGVIIGKMYSNITITSSRNRNRNRTK